MSRVDQYNVTITVNGVNLGTFDKMSGGEIDSEETKYKPGAMAPQISLGGSQTVSNITASRLYDLTRDPPLAKSMRAGVGKFDCTVTKQSLDVDHNPFGDPIVYKGKLKKLKYPDPDSEGNSAGMVEIEISSAGLVS